MTGDKDVFVSRFYVFCFRLNVVRGKKRLFFTSELGKMPQNTGFPHLTGKK